VNGDMEKKLEELKEWMEEWEEGVKTIIGVDFNARTGREGGKVKKKGKREKGIRRITRNKERRMLVKGIRERGWMIMNGGIKGDEEAGWIYMVEGKSRS